MSQMVINPNYPAISNEVKEATENFIAFLSSKSYPDFRLDNVFDIYMDYLTNDYWIDPASPKFVQFLKLPRTVEYKHDGSAVTSISFKLYGTTSLWWLIISCSPYLHPHQIPTGEIIMLPDFMSIRTLVKEVVESNIGKEIII